MTQKLAQTTQHNEHEYRRTGTERPRAPHPQRRTHSVHSGEPELSGPGHRAQDTAHQGRHTGEEEPSGPGHRTRNTTQRACTLVNRGQVAHDAAHTTPHAERAHR